MNEMKISAQLTPWSDSIELRIGIRHGNGKFGVFQAPVVQFIEDGDVIEPFMHMSISDAQTLMNQLWHCGVRPSDGTGSTGQLAATERHLADMQRLVFKDKK